MSIKRASSILIILAVILLASCQGAEVEQPPINPSDTDNNRKELDSPVQENKSQEESLIEDEVELVTRFLDESQYEGDELEIVQLFNQYVRYSMAGDAEGLKSQMSDRYSIKHKPWGELTTKTYALNDIQFLNVTNEDEMEVYVQMEHYNFVEKYFFTSGPINYMIREEGTWKILLETN